MSEFESEAAKEYAAVGHRLIPASIIRDPERGPLHVVLRVDAHNRCLQLLPFHRDGFTVGVHNLLLPEQAFEIASPISPVPPFALLSYAQSTSESTLSQPGDFFIAEQVFRRLRIIPSPEAYAVTLARAAYAVGYLDQAAIRRFSRLAAIAEAGTWQPRHNLEFDTLLDLFLTGAIDYPVAYTIDGWI